MLSNAYFLARFRFDTAENEPAKILQTSAKNANFAHHGTEVTEDALLHVNEEMWAAMRLPPSLYPNIGLAIKLMNGWKDGAAGSRMAQESARLSLPLRRHHDYLRCPRTSVSTFDSVLGRDPETHTSPCPNATV